MSRVYETSDERRAILGNIVEDKENLILAPKIFRFSLKITAVLLYEREFCPSFRIKQLLYRIEGWSVFNREPLQFTFLTVLMKPARSVDAMYRNT